ncbi:outer membrane beta-barrel protein [Pontibacter sp. SGAir0037]|uniref:outer membrane beta-barrel protein n=1 Tax=Pontibacter sp. SGAir0037 TaxID=2571030 RepID=UPI0010CD5E6B|nr:outer membrane beta-barrel protein [Pontibacter sp. SGAir0037]QCR21572.1 hypothetical protein C1N53_03885 [Pontibacter sp. SGAir0037]
MKTLFTTALLALLGTGVFAQTSQGTFAVSGSVSYYNSNGNTSSLPTTISDTNRNLALRPSVGYFISDGTEAGISVGITSSLRKTIYDTGENISKNNSVTLGVYLRKYVALTEQLSLHGTGYISAGLGKTRYSNTSSADELTQNTNNYAIGLYPGLTYFATPKLGLTASFGNISFSRQSTKLLYENDDRSVSSKFDANLSFSSFGIGLSYFIAR